MRVAIKLIGIGVIFMFMGLLLPLHAPGQGRQRLLQKFMKLCCRVMGVRIRFEGAYAGNAPKILIANHISYLDIFVIGSLFPTSFMGKLELESWPVLSHLGKFAQTVFVERTSVLSRLRALYAVKRTMHDSNYCIFPEGTTTSHALPSSRNWHRGHAILHEQTDDGIYCLGLNYSDQTDIAWVGDDSLVPHLLKLLARKHVDVYVAGAYLPKSITDRKMIAKESLRSVASLAKQAAEFQTQTFKEPISLEVDYPRSGAYAGCELTPQDQSP